MTVRLRGKDGLVGDHGDVRIMRTGSTHGERSEVPDDRLRDGGALIPRRVAKHKTGEAIVSFQTSPWTLHRCIGISLSTAASKGIARVYRVGPAARGSCRRGVAIADGRWSETARRPPGASIRTTPGAPTRRDDGDTCEGLARELSWNIHDISNLGERCKTSVAAPRLGDLW